MPEMQIIGQVHSCFKEKFGIPRQPGLVTEACAEIEILSPFDRDEAFTGLESFSHIWVIFVFHQCQRDKWKATVRPPRLGGNQRVGVFASRSTFRPNPLGLSVVKFEGLARRQGKLYVQISGMDLLQGTPVLDIKPYLPYADSLAEASGGYAPQAPKPLAQLRFSEQAERQCQQYGRNYPGGYTPLYSLIENLLRLDPRPAYRSRGSKEEADIYAMRLLDFDLRWQVQGEDIVVLALDSRR